MRVAFRLDASADTGSGHLMRCLTLADELAARGASCAFAVREVAEPFVARVAVHGHVLMRFSADSEVDDAEATSAAVAAWGGADVVVVDHYGLDAAWEGRVASVLGAGLCAIDDLADRPHDCRVLIDQNLYRDSARYDRLVPPDAVRLFGPRYAILRPEFARLRAITTPRAGEVRRLLVFFGGVDAGDETGKALAALAGIGGLPLVDVVAGAANPHLGGIRRLAAALPDATVHVDTDRMGELMAAADLCVGAAGTTTWERACLGLPAVVVAVADNQVEAIAELDRVGAVRYIGEGEHVSEEAIHTAVSGMLADPAAVASCSRISWDLTDGLGAGRCADVMATLI